MSRATRSGDPAPSMRRLQWVRLGMNALSLREGPQEHARLQFSPWSSKAEVQEGDARFGLAVRGFWRQHLVFLAGGEEVGTGRCRYSTLDLLLRGKPYRWHRPSIWRAGWEMHGPDGLVATMRKRQVELHDFPTELPLLLAAPRVWDRYQQGMVAAAMVPIVVVAAT